MESLRSVAIGHAGVTDLEGRFAVRVDTIRSSGADFTLAITVAIGLVAFVVDHAWSSAAEISVCRCASTAMTVVNETPGASAFVSGGCVETH